MESGMPKKKHESNFHFHHQYRHVDGENKAKQANTEMTKMR
jgi:hypothetical protein